MLSGKLAVTLAILAVLGVLVVLPIWHLFLNSITLPRGGGLGIGNYLAGLCFTNRLMVGMPLSAGRPIL